MGRTQLERFGGVKSRDREKEDLQAKSRGFIMVTIDLRVGQFGSRTRNCLQVARVDTTVE